MVAKEIVVDDVGENGNIDTTSGDIGDNQNVSETRSELLNLNFSGRLVQGTVDIRDSVSKLAEKVVEIFDVVLCGSENNGGMLGRSFVGTRAIGTTLALLGLHAIFLGLLDPLGRTAGHLDNVSEDVDERTLLLLSVDGKVGGFKVGETFVSASRRISLGS